MMQCMKWFIAFVVAAVGEILERIKGVTQTTFLRWYAFSVMISDSKWMHSQQDFCHCRFAWHASAIKWLHSYQDT